MSLKKHSPTIMAAPSMPVDPLLTVVIESLMETAKTCAEAGATAFRIPFCINDMSIAHAQQLMESLICAHHKKLCFQVSLNPGPSCSINDLNTFIREIQPPAVSVALHDICKLDQQTPAQIKYLYDWLDDMHIGIQHVIYNVQDIRMLEKIISINTSNSFLFAMRKTDDTAPNATDLLPFMDALDKSVFSGCTWMVCVQGMAETSILTAAALLGGHCQVGLTHNNLHTDGTRARYDAERVMDLQFCLMCLGLTPSTVISPDVLGCNSHSSNNA